MPSLTRRAAADHPIVRRRRTRRAALVACGALVASLATVHLAEATPTSRSSEDGSDQRRWVSGGHTIPVFDLDEAITAMERSELVAETLGEHVFDFFLRNKRAEWQEYRRQITEYELGRYLPIL